MHFIGNKVGLVHCIFSFSKGVKEKDAVSIPYAILFSEQDFEKKFKKDKFFFLVLAHLDADSYIVDYRINYNMTLTQIPNYKSTASKFFVEIKNLLPFLKSKDKSIPSSKIVRMLLLLLNNLASLRSLMRNFG
jgi:hypothetical protein